MQLSLCPVVFAILAGSRKLFRLVKDSVMGSLLSWAVVLSFGTTLAYLIAEKLPHAPGGFHHFVVGLWLLNPLIWQGLSYSSRQEE